MAESWVSAGFGDGRRGRERLLGNYHSISDMDEILLTEYTKVKTDFERIIFL